MGVECSEPYSHGFFPFEGRPDTYWDCDTGGSGYGHWEMETTGSQGQPAAGQAAIHPATSASPASTDISHCTPAKSYPASASKNTATPTFCSTRIGHTDQMRYQIGCPLEFEGAASEARPPSSVGKPTGSGAQQLGKLGHLELRRPSTTPRCHSPPLF